MTFKIATVKKDFPIVCKLQIKKFGGKLGIEEEMSGSLSDVV